MPDIIITPNDGTIEFIPSSSTVNKIEASGNTLNLINTSNSNGTIFNIEGTNGSLFSVVDDLSGTLMSVNNNSGLPVFEVFNDDKIIAGRFNKNDFVLSNGYLGIGNDPQDYINAFGYGTSLTLGDGSNTAIFMRGSSNSNNYIYFIEGTSIKGHLTFSHIEDSLFFGAGGVGINMALDADGDFGIGTAYPSARLNVEGGNVIFNDNGGNFDFRVEGDTDSNLLFVDASTDRIGIGTDTPASKLHVNGEIRASGNIVPAADNTGVVGTAALTWNNGQFTNLTIDSTLNVLGAVDLADNDILRLGTGDDWEFFHNGTHNYIDLTNGDLIIRDDGTTGDPTRLYLTRAGNLGVGVSSAPQATLEVVGGASVPFQVGDINGSQPFFSVRAGSAFISAAFGRSSAQANCRIQYYSNPATSGNYWRQDADETSFSLTRVASNVADTTVFKLQNGAATFNNAFTLPSVDGLSGQSLVTNGSGVVSWTSLTNITRGSFTPSSSQSVFTVNDGYAVGGLDVYYNGIKLLSGTDYTATNGTSFTLTNTAVSGDIIEYVALSAASMDANTVRGSVAASDGQTVFNVSGGYTVGNLDVFLNGIKLLDGTDFTATNGTSITLTSAAALGDVLEYNAYGLVVASNGLQKTGDTMTGNLTLGSNSILFDSSVIDNNSLDINICNGRLTLESGVPVSTTDQTARTTLYFTPYNGNRICLYDTSLSKWKMHSFSQLSLSLSGLVANTNYDVFVYDNSGTLTLETTAWTDNTTRATELTTQDNIYVKTGAVNRRYLGTIRTTSSTGQCEDSVTKRFVWNYYNREERLLRRYASGNWTYATAAWRVFAGASASTYSVDVVTGLSQDSIFLKAGLLYTIAVTTSTIYYIAVAQDSSINIVDIGNTNNAVERVQSVSANQTQLVSELDHIVPLGYHYYYPIEYRESGGTPTLYATNTTFWGGLLGTWRC